MKKLMATTIMLLLVAAVAGTVVAEDQKPVTLEGKVLCAKCALHEEGRTKCQNVLMVEEDGKEQYYYLTETEANKAFGDVCMATPKVRVTGTVSNESGKMFLAASKMERVDPKG